MEIKHEVLSPQQVRQLVDGYLVLSQQRKLLAGFAAGTEREIEQKLDAWTETRPAAKWAKGIASVAPVMAAGLDAHIDIELAPTVGSLWRFAGLDPTAVRMVGERRPWNPSLKRVCLLIGHAFVGAAGKRGDFYGGLYRKRLAMETAANARRSGIDRLEPAHLVARARRWTVKLFLAHYHQVAWTLANGAPPAKPYAIAVLGRGQFIAPPNFDGGRA